MAETSMPWDSATIPSNTFDDTFSSIWTDGYISGVIPAVSNTYLVPSGATSPVAIAAGAAWVNGKRYVNSAPINVTIGNAASNTRIDRIVLRQNFAAKTVTVQLLSGTAAPAPTVPALTQTDGTTWEVSICQVLVTTGGAITLTPELTRSEPKGAHQPYDLKPWAGTMSGHYPVDARTGAADTRWHLCNGNTENGIVTPNMANMMLMCSGGTYAAGTTGGAASANLPNHVHPSAAHVHGGTVLGGSGIGSHAVASGGDYQVYDATHNYNFTTDSTTPGNTSNPTSTPAIATLSPYYAVPMLCYVGA